MPQQRVADIPELLSSIALYLPLRDLRSCSQVSRLWRDAFLPFVWQTLTPSHPAAYISRRAHWMHCLYGPVHIPEILMQPHCTNLIVLHLSQRSFWPKRTVPNFRSQQDINDLWIRFIRQNPRIEELYIEGTGVREQYILMPFLERLHEVLPGLSDLASLSIQGCLRPDQMGALLAAISPKLWHLRLDVKGMMEEDLATVTFSELKSLQIDCPLNGSFESFLTRHSHAQQQLLLAPLLSGLLWRSSRG